ncbi:MAG: hypothetical protein ABI091_20780 [Ferruginibacter sp.]
MKVKNCNKIVIGIDKNKLLLNKELADLLMRVILLKSRPMAALPA